jgi:hypothetical protein
VLVFFIDSWLAHASPLSRCLAGAVDLRPLQASEFFPSSMSILSPRFENPSSPFLLDLAAGTPNLSS